MSKNKKILLIAGVVCLIVCLSIVLVMCGGNAKPSGNGGSGDTVTYTIEVKSSAGLGLADIGI